MAPCGLLAKHLRSREASTPPRFANVPITQSEGAERRQALGCLRGTLGRASDAGPQALARRLASRTDQLAQSARRGRSPLGAPPRRFIGPGPALVKLSGGAQRGGALSLTLAHSRVPLVVAEGRVSPGASRGCGYEPRPQDAASRSAFGSSPEDALGERDADPIGPSRNNVKDKIPWICQVVS
jgi:hypothetical protein